MSNNEIKKTLYKGDFWANLAYIRKGVAYYKEEQLGLLFEVPYADMGDATFNASIEAKYLIRWLKEI